MSDTPRTEAALKASRNQFDALQKLTSEAAKLERENAELRASLDSLRNKVAEAADGLLTPQQQAAIPGSGIDGHRDAGNLRAIIAALSSPNAK